MSTNSEAGPSKKRRQYAVRACNGCRRRRCKCDGVQPTCGTCAHTGHECSWNLEADARRPATKQLVESLRVKIQLLETEVAQLRQNPHTPPAESGAGPSTRPSRVNPANAVESSGFLNELRILGVDVPATHDPAAFSLQLNPSPSTQRPEPVPTAQYTSTALYRFIFQIDQSVPTSEQATDIRLSLVCDWRRHLPNLGEVGVEMSREDHDIILARGFQYGTSWLLGLVPELFLHDMLFALTTPSTSQSFPPSTSSYSPSSPSSPQPRLQHYSPLLHCALLAFACAFSPLPTLRSRATRARFATHAKQWLDEEFRRPVMSLIAALALLGEYHCGIGERDAGYMYMGMSIRAARALIPSAGKEPEVNQGIMAYPDSIARDWHFWSTFAQDKLMALEYGRVYDMPIPHMGVSLPCVDTELDALPWPAEPEPPTSHEGHTPMDMSVYPPAAPRQGKATTGAFLESCKLMVIAGRVMDMAGAQGGVALEDGALMNIHLQLDTWFNNLPANFLVWARSTSPLPHVIVLHICYWWLVLHLHQPFYATGQTARLPVGDLSVKMCDRAAHKMVQLVGMYKDNYGLRFFPRNTIQAIYVSGTALLRESANAPAGAVKKRATALEGVYTCIRSLKIIGETWPCAIRWAEELARASPDSTGDDVMDDPGAEMELDELEDDADELPTSASTTGGPPPEMDDRFESEERSDPHRQGEVGVRERRASGADRMSYPPTHEQWLQSHDSDLYQMRRRNVTVKITAFKVNDQGKGVSGERRLEEDMGFLRAFPVSWVV